MTEYNEDTEARLMALESRIAFSEQRLAALERGGKLATKRKRRELTPEEREAIRERLVKGQEAARARREAEAKAQAKKVRKEANDGASEATD